MDSGVCELRPCHGGCRSFQNTQGALGPPGHLFLNPVEWTSFLVSKGYKGTASFSLSCRVSSSQVNPSHPGVTLAAPCSRPPECEGLSVCVHLPSGLSHHQNGPGWSLPGGAVEMPLSAWVNLRASYFIHGLFCARLLILCLHGAFEGSKKRKVTTQRMNCTDHWRLWWQVLRERS